MKLQCIKIVSLFFMVLAVSSCAQSDSLTLTLTLDKTIYHIGEPINATLVLKNTGINTVLIKKRMALNRSTALENQRDISFMIFNPSGSQLDLYVLPRVVDIQPMGFMELMPSQAIERHFNLAETYLPTDTKGHYYSSLVITGNYTIYAIYESKTDLIDGRSIWTGALTSNTVKFSLEP